MMRMFNGPDNRRLIPLAFLLGAILLLAADTVTRAVLPYEVPIGVITALAGGPLFCYIFWKKQPRWPGGRSFVTYSGKSSGWRAIDDDLHGDRGTHLRLCWD